MLHVAIDQLDSFVPVEVLERLVQASSCIARFIVSEPDAEFADAHAFWLKVQANLWPAVFVLAAHDHDLCVSFVFENLAVH